jgi:hypothetical protein
LQILAATLNVLLLLNLTISISYDAYLLKHIFQAVLATGQLLNLLTVPAAFLLGRRLGGSDWAGTFAALITGLLSEYPMFYMNWGRYTQLASQVILPTIMILTWLALKSHKFDFKLLVLISLGVGGLALTHYRVLFLYPCFVIPLLWLECIQVKWKLSKLRGSILYLIGIVLGSFIIISPWLWRVIGGRLWQVNSAIITSGSNSKPIQEIVNLYPSIFEYVPPLIVILGIMAVIWGSWQRREGIIITAGWGLLMLLIANPYFIYLPGAGVIPYFAMLIAAYLPFSILAGFTLAQITQRVVSFHWTISWAVTLVTLGISLIGAQQRALSFMPGYTLVTKPDLAAMEWIRQNTPPEATFWINARLAYGDTTVVGTDAGWWIPFLTERQGLVLPMIYGTEMTTPPEYSPKILNLYRQTHQGEFTSFEVWQTLKQAGVTHIYIGQRRGEVWRGTEQPLDPIALQNSPYYHMVYRQDQVWIFALKQL